MRPALLTLAALGACAPLGATGCATGFGAAVGLQSTSGGDTAVMVRAWGRAGSRLDGAAPGDDDGHQAGLFWLPTAQVAAGWDIAGAGPRLEVGGNLLGYVRAPRDRDGWAMAAQSGFRGSFHWPDSGGAETTVGFSGGITAARVLAASIEPAARAGEPPTRSMHTLGVMTDATVNIIGDAPVTFFVGPHYEYLGFFDIALSEGAREAPPGEAP